MNVIVLQLFVSLMLVLGSIVLFIASVRQRDHEHTDRLALAPLEPEQTVPSTPDPPDPITSKEPEC